MPKKRPFTAKELAERKAFVEKYARKSPQWWEENMNLVFDGVTLTKPPQALTGRQKHAAQSITRMWMKKGETLDSRVHTHNRYGVQFGDKVALWGGFTGGGDFAFCMWTPKPKMKKEEWAARIGKLKKAINDADDDAPARPKVWHDNERFLLNASAYRRAGLSSVRFPPGSGDLNPIETVWARLRKDLASREHADLKRGKVLSIAQFKARAKQLLNSYAKRAPGARWNYYQKLARGMKALRRASLWGRPIGGVCVKQHDLPCCPTHSLATAPS